MKRAVVLVACLTVLPHLLLGLVESAAPECPAFKGEYFSNRTLSGSPVLVRCDSEINFDWGSSAPASGLPADNFSVRWTRTLTLPAGTYTFTTVSDDGVRLWLDGVRIINNWSTHSTTTNTATRTLTAGVRTIRMEFFERSGLAVARLSWSVPASPPSSGGISVTPANINFSYTIGGALPGPQSVTVTVPGGGVWSTFDESPFYNATPACAFGTCSSGTATTLTPSTVIGLAAGTYSSPLIIRAAGFADVVVPVSLVVSAPSSPPPPPAPTVTLSAAPPTVAPEGSSVLQWSSTNATSCTASGGWSGARALSGQATVTPLTTTSYSLTCSGEGGMAGQGVTVAVATTPELTLNWSGDPDATFKIERKPGTAGTYAQIATTGMGIMSFVDTSVSLGNSYCYRVRASNSFGDSDYSNEACGSVSP